MLSLNQRKGWRKIRGFEKYRITRTGHVFIADGCIEISQALNVDKYFRVALWKNGRRTRKFVHRLVAEHFIRNPHPRIYDQVNHMDWDKIHNSWRNLEWCTGSQNIIHAHKKPFGYVNRFSEIPGEAPF